MTCPECEKGTLQTCVGIADKTVMLCVVCGFEEPVCDGETCRGL